MTGDGAASADIWQVSFDLPDRSGVDAFEDSLEDAVTGLSSFEIPGTPGWRITGYTAGEPDRADILARLGAAAAKTGTALPDVDVLSLIHI